MIATGGSFSARIPHLKASTAYVCRAYSGTSISTEKTFTTTAAIELPNASFDYWSMDGKVANPWEENSTPFWDTGNIGVTTASQSNSTPTDDTAAGSGKAARLESKNVIVKFAAGNLFTGKFIKVDGTNGILNFGQPFTGRPTKLKDTTNIPPHLLQTCQPKAARTIRVSKITKESPIHVPYTSLWAIGRNR